MLDGERQAPGAPGTSGQTSQSLVGSDFVRAMKIAANG
jgi:hypothetical protein